MKTIDLALKELKPEPAKAAGKGANARGLLRRYALEAEAKLQEQERNENEMRAEFGAAMATSKKNFIQKIKSWVKQESFAGSKPPASERSHVGSKTPVLGSEDGKVHSQYDVGFFETVLAAYNNHWALRTCPEDWWYCIVQKVARAVDDNSKSDNVRKFFVDHDGKKKLTVEVGPTIYGVDYSWFFDQMTGLINDNIKVPKYVDTMTSDFSCTTTVQRIISQIAVMTSMQEFFEYEMMLCCGIPSVEMAGQEDDWLKLVEKFRLLKKLMEPISEDIQLKDWWGPAEGVLLKLVDTYNGKADKEWWSRIINIERNYGSGPPEEWSGWIITEFLGEHGIEKVTNFKSGLVSVPMKVTDAATGHSEDSALIAGIAGYKVDPSGKIPAVEAHHGWSMLLEPNSAFRNDMDKWEKKINRGG